MKLRRDIYARGDQSPEHGPLIRGLRAAIAGAAMVGVLFLGHQAAQLLGPGLEWVSLGELGSPSFAGMACGTAALGWLTAPPRG